MGPGLIVPPGGGDSEIQKRVDKLQRVVLVESKEIKGLKDANTKLEQQVQSLNTN